MMKILFLVLVFTHLAYAESYRSENPLTCEVVPETTVDDFAKSVSSLITEEFVDMPQGYRMHKSCFKQFGAELTLYVEKSLNDGMSCLTNLNGAGAKTNLKNFHDILAKKELKVFCNEQDYHWSKAAAHGSLGHQSDKPRLGMIHPFMSINPNYSFHDEEGKQKIDPSFLEAVFFHEIFHNFGYAHTKTVDYAYACEDCCISEMTPEGKAAACKICSNSYQDRNDPKYIADLVDWSHYSEWWKSINASLVMRLALLKHPGEKSLLKILNTESGYFSSYPELKKAREALFVKGDKALALKFYQDFDPTKLNAIFTSFPEDSPEYKAAWKVWDNALYDLDAVFDGLDDDSEEAKQWNMVWFKIRESLPKKSRTPDSGNNT